MSCDCIKRLETLLNEKMAEKYPGAEVIDKVAFVEKTITFDNEGHTAVILGNPVLGKVRVGKAVRKYETQILPTYCPFCGKKIKEGGENDNQ